MLGLGAPLSAPLMSAQFSSIAPSLFPSICTLPTPGLVWTIPPPGLSQAACHAAGLKWVSKDPADLDNARAVDWTYLLPRGATLAGPPIIVVTPQGLTIGAAENLGTFAYFQVLGGKNGTTYSISMTVTDSVGGIRHETFPLVCKVA